MATSARWPELSLREAGVALIDCEHRTPPAVPDGYPYVAIPQMKSGRIDPTTARRVSAEDYVDWTRKALPRDHDVVLSRRTNPGETAVAPPGLEYVLGQNLVLLRADGSRVYPPFLRWLVRGPEWWEQIGRFLNVGAVFDSLRCADVPNFRLRIPRIVDQEWMSAVLGALDDKIELNRRMNETLEATARALFKSWFVDFDPVRAKTEGHDPGLPPRVADLFPDSFDDSELGEIPAGWTVEGLGAIADVVDCSHARKPERRTEGRPLLQLGNIVPYGMLDPSDLFLIDASDYEAWTARIEVREGDCVITNVGRVGAVAQIPHGFRAALGRNMTGIRCRPAWPYPTHLIELIRSDAFRAEVDARTDTGTILDALNVRSIPRLRHVHPCAELVRAFEVLARPIRTRMEDAAMESRNITALRDTLLPRLISGELRVPDAERMVDARI